MVIFHSYVSLPEGKWLAQLKKKNELQMGSTELGEKLILQVAGVTKVEWGVIAG